MKSVLLRSVFRQIRSTLGRYLAILAIIAMGVGFFAGLRGATPAMLATADAYFDELNLYDFRLISTLGLTAEDVEAVAAAPGVSRAAGSVSADFLFRDASGSDRALHAHSLTEGINLPELRAGRLPETGAECLGDYRCFTEADLGTDLVFSENNPEDIGDTFARDRYTLVGLIDAPTYANYERGSSSLGSGSAAGFVYLPPEAFSADYFTEIYALADCGAALFSDEYDEWIPAETEILKPLLRERADLRYNTLRSDAEEEIADAESELADARDELADGWETYRTERADAETELADAKQQLAAARTELDDAAAQRDTLAETLEMPYLPAAQHAYLEAQLEEVDSQLAEGEDAYAENLDAYVTAVADAYREFADAEAELRDGEAEVQDGEAELADAKAELADLKPPVTYLLDRSDDVGCAGLENDTSIVSAISGVFPVFFFLVAALVCVTTMTRMVDEQRTENGVLKALGYGSGAIACRYLLYAGSASLLGCIAGFLLGSAFLPRALWKIYMIMYSVERPCLFVPQWKLFFLCTALFLFCALGAAWLVCRRDLREAAAELIRPKAPHAGKRILLERFKFFWKRVRFLPKVSIRNTLLYKKRMVMMIIGIGGCTALLLAGFGIRDTIKPLVDRQYDEIEVFDATVSFAAAPDAEERSDFSEKFGGAFSDAAFAACFPVDIADAGEAENANAVCFSGNMRPFIDLHSGETAVAWPERGEAVLNYRLAEACSLTVGDSVTLLDESLRPLTVTVSGIFDNYIGNYVFLSEETYEALLGEPPETKTLYVNFVPDTDEGSLTAAILSTDNVANVSLTSEMRSRIGGMLERMDLVVLLVLVCAGALAFIVLYNLTNISITERRREIATLKVLGFFPNETAAYVFRENLILTAISALCGIPMGLALTRFVMGRVHIKSMYFGCLVEPMSYVWAVAITFVFALLVDLLLLKKLNSVDMAESMKAVE